MENDLIRYIQIEEDLEIIVVNDIIVKIEKDRILPILDRTFFTEYYTQSKSTIKTSYKGNTFILENTEAFRVLSLRECNLYKQQVIIVSAHDTYPIETELRSSLFKGDYLTVGKIVIIDGFSYDSYDKKYVPFYRKKNVCYELDCSKFILHIELVSLFKKKVEISLL